MRDQQRVCRHILLDSLGNRRDDHFHHNAMHFVPAEDDLKMMMMMCEHILHISMKNNKSNSGSYGHSISHMTPLLHRSLHYCVTSPAHRCSDLTLSRNDNERWAPPPRALTPLPVPSGLQSPNFNTFWNRYFFLLLLSSVQTIASGFWLHRGKEGIVNDFAPVVLARIYKTKLGLDYHCNEEK